MIRKILTLGLLCANAHANVITSAISTPPLSCVVDHRCDIRAKHDINISNDTARPQTYYYTYKLCVLREGTETDCVFISKQIVVAPWQKWNNHYDSFIQPRFAYAQAYSYHVLTQVFGIDNSITDMQYMVRVDNFK